MMKFLMLAALILLPACNRENARNMKLIPVNEVTVYRNVAGDDALGLSSNPLPVTNLIYLDKTDYVVEVTYEGKRGYVRRGFRLSKE